VTLDRFSEGKLMTHYTVCFQKTLLAMAALAAGAGPLLADGALANGANVTGTISQSAQIDRWTFTAGVNDAVSVSMSEVGVNSTFQPWIRVLGPASQLMGGATGSLSAEVDFTAAAAGVYTVLASRYDATAVPGHYTLTLAKAPGAFIVPSGDEGGLMVNGGNYTGTLLRGDLDQWSFTASAGEAVSVSVSEVGVDTTFQPWIRVHAPNGTLMGGATGGRSAEVDFSAPIAGTYTVLLARYDRTDGPGHYLLTLAGAPGAVTVPTGDEGGAIFNGGNYTGKLLRGDLDQWTFSASAGDAVSLTMSEVGTNTGFQPWIRVHGPNGALMGGAAGNLWSAVNFTAPSTGKYTVLASRYDNLDGTGQYQLTLAKAPGRVIVPVGDEGGPIVDGGNYSGKLLRGDLDQWTFTAAVGDAISVTVSEIGTDTAFQPWIRVHAPNGTLMGGATGSRSAEVDFTAPSAGTYTVLVSRYDTADGTGQYELTLAQAPGRVTVPVGDEGGPIVNGGNYTGYLLRGDLDQWTFTATTGNAISVSASEVGPNTAFMPWLRVHAPNGALMGGATGNLSAEVDFTAPVTGTYIVLVSRYDNADGTGQYELTLAQAPGSFVVPAGDEGGTLSLGVARSGTILRGDLDQWSVSAVQGQRVTVTINEVGVDTPFQPWIRVHAPNGTLMGGATGNVSATVTFIAPITGSYTVLVSRYDNADGVGTYQISTSH
jgi:hypothetical protein